MHRPPSTASTNPANHGPSRVLTGDDHARWAPLVRRTAMRVARRAPDGITVEALCRRGFLGLLEGLASAEAMAPGEPLEPYVEHRIRSAMLDFLRSANPSVRSARSASRELARTLRAMLDGGQTDAGEEQIAGALGLSVAAYEDVLASIAAAGLARIDVVDLDREGDTDAIGVPLSRATLALAIEELPLRERNLLGLVFGEDLTTEETAAVLGMSIRRVTCLLTQTVHRLRAALGRE